MRSKVHDPCVVRHTPGHIFDIYGRQTSRDTPQTVILQASAAAVVLRDHTCG